jgi:hypothetical protein
MIALFALSLAAADDAKPEFPTVKFSGVLFPRWSLDLTDGSELKNEFAVDRVYLRADAALAKNVGVRITLDADHMKDATLPTGETVTYDTKYRVFVKHAYVEVKDLGPLKARAGVVETPYTPWYDNLWGNRYIAESFAKNEKILSTADLGVSLLGKHADGLVDWNLSVLNGEGYDKIELDAGKAVQARITVNPLAKMKEKSLPITGFVSYQGQPSTVGEAQLVYGGGAGFDMPRLFVWAEVLGTSQAGNSGFGYSATINPRLPKYIGVIGRYDHFDPTSGTDGDEHNLLIAGLDKDFMEKLSLALTYERNWYGTDQDGATQMIALHGQAGF